MSVLTEFRTRNVLSLAVATAATFGAVNATAESKLGLMLEEVVVTATKKASAEQLQDVPLAVTAFNDEQLDILHIRDLKGLSYSMPNVSMDDVGSSKGVANFSIRGLGINSSIPSIDPTVGVFIDGVYLGTTSGVLFDQFDLDSIEVLRGPQGLLFGRNVTGGAVVINTKKPSEEFEGSIRTSVESGLNKYISAVVTGPLIEDKLLGKLAVYRNDDDGYFKNKFNGNDNFGESSTTLVRGALTYFPDEGVELTVRYEHGESDGDGVAGKSLAIHERDSFDISVNDEGFYDSEWDMLSASLTMDVGEGVLTNIIGWRELDSILLSDVDSTPGSGFNFIPALNSEQISNELRYNITLDERVDVTAGLYYFEQEINYAEQRLIAGGAVDLSGGGTQDQSTWGVFLSADWMLSDSVTLITGVRYTQEEKEVKIATIGASKLCDVNSVSCSGYDFDDDEDWANITPKVGLQWFVAEDVQLYATYSKGFRSGGYNLRNTSPTASPGPFDEEEQDSFEVGVKLDALDGKLRFNAAAFHNSIEGMQREVNVPDTATGAVQIIRNTADATITGVEMELTLSLTDSLLLNANLGIIDSDYDKVLFDLSGDGVVDDTDKSLGLPRLAPTTYGISLTHESKIFNDMSMLARVSFNHRDESYYSDNNLGLVDAADVVDASVKFSNEDGRWSLSVFGRNLKNEAIHSMDTKLPGTALFGGVGASFTPLSKGRVYGAEVIYNF